MRPRLLPSAAALVALTTSLLPAAALAAGKKTFEGSYIRIRNTVQHTRSEKVTLKIKFRVMRDGKWVGTHETTKEVAPGADFVLTDNGKKVLTDRIEGSYSYVELRGTKKTVAFGGAVNPGKKAEYQAKKPHTFELLLRDQPLERPPAKKATTKRPTPAR